MKKFEEEWLNRSKMLEKGTYYKVFSKYSQVAKFKLTNIYDPPLTMKEIKKLRRERKRQAKARVNKRRNVRSPSPSV